MAFLCYVAINTVQNSLPHRTQYLGDPTLVFPDHGDVHLAPESGIISYYLPLRRETQFSVPRVEIFQLLGLPR